MNLLQNLVSSPKNEKLKCSMQLFLMIFFLPSISGLAPHHCLPTQAGSGATTTHFAFVTEVLLAFVLQPLHLAPVAALPMCLHPLHPILQRKQFTRQTISHHAPTHSIASEPKSTFYVLFGFFAIID